ncbi:NADP-dependent oxidoreductase [Parvularcula dongshanensis]|uniref:Enoyl reductase (ER) domain-containing protein n=1 Tax=Parvularcula dongshanensis TaxID=1173995 RepID=A0A840I269_9PROT|nr:NADP-dependent oxidoreductase [Parvularcula dongshanensis]MBB4658372.1 hypothetical protein [Parvularcula dongshanensis]
MTTAREIHLTRYPEGKPTLDIFETVERDLPAPKEGEVLAETLYLSVDPYMRGRMRPDVKSYIPPFALDEPLDGGAVGRVLESKVDGFAPGDLVVAQGGLGWRSHGVVPAGALRKIDPSLAPPSAFLGVLGMPGLTAWAGLTQLIRPKAGETLYVSGAAGAVGSLVCQLGKQKGLRVIGSAGTKEKRDWLVREARCDAAVGYKEHDAASLTTALRDLAPKGIDGYFENVGGMQLEAVLNCINDRGRIALCGLISQYNATEAPAGPSNFANLLTRQVLMEGFIVTRFMDRTEEFLSEVAPLVAAGRVKHEETVYEGLDRAPAAFVGLFEGTNTGKMVVKVAE